MKIKLICIIILITIMLTGCVDVQKENEDNKTSMFIQLETASSWKIVYHKDTRVMYAISGGGYNTGTFTLLVDADGTPMVYDEVEK